MRIHTHVHTQHTWMHYAYTCTYSVIFRGVLNFVIFGVQLISVTKLKTTKFQSHVPHLGVRYQVTKLKTMNFRARSRISRKMRPPKLPAIRHMHTYARMYARTQAHKQACTHITHSCILCVHIRTHTTNTQSHIPLARVYYMYIHPPSWPFGPATYGTFIFITLLQRVDGGRQCNSQLKLLLLKLVKIAEKDTCTCTKYSHHTTCACVVVSKC